MSIENDLLLSVFPGIDLLGSAFEQQGFCVVRAPEKFLGGDIRHFNPPRNKFNGLVGGSMCQDFSLLNRNPTNESLEMQEEYIRVVVESDVDWFLYENVATAPDFKIDGYICQRFQLDLAWFSEYSRNRKFIFGSKSGKLLSPITKTKSKELAGTAVTGSDERSIEAMCEIQGLASDFHKQLEHFTLSGKKQVIANGVPMQLGLYVAGLIKEVIYNTDTDRAVIAQSNFKRCECGCKRPVHGRKRYAGDACRQRAKRQRDALLNDLP